MLLLFCSVSIIIAILSFLQVYNLYNMQYKWYAFRKSLLVQTMTRLMELLQQDDKVDVDVNIRRFSSAGGIDGLSQPFVCIAIVMYYHETSSLFLFHFPGL